MRTMSKLDKILIRMGYVAASFILIMTAGAIIVAIIHMYRNGKIPVVALSEADRPLALAASDRHLIEERKITSGKPNS